MNLNKASTCVLSILVCLFSFVSSETVSAAEVAGNDSTNTKKSETRKVNSDLKEISYKLRRGASFGCKNNTRSDLGISFLDDDQTALIVDSIIPGSPADKANIKPQDRISKIFPNHENKNAHPLPANLSNLKKTAVHKKAFQVKVKRNGKTLRRTIEPTKTCDLSITSIESDEANIFVDESSIQITSEMLEITRDKNDLAVVVSHAVGHQLLEHQNKHQRNQIIGMALDMGAFAMGVPTLGMFSYMGYKYNKEEREKAADKIGMYVMARSNLAYEKTRDVWRYLRTHKKGTLPGENYLRSSMMMDPIVNTYYLHEHPLSDDRKAFMSKTNEEIDQRKRKKLVLKPDEPLVPQNNQTTTSLRDDPTEPSQSELNPRGKAHPTRTALASPEPTSASTNQQESRIAQNKENTSENSSGTNKISPNLGGSKRDMTKNSKTDDKTKLVSNNTDNPTASSISPPLNPQNSPESDKSGPSTKQSTTESNANKPSASIADQSKPTAKLASKNHNNSQTKKTSKPNHKKASSSSNNKSTKTNKNKETNPDQLNNQTSDLTSTSNSSPDNQKLKTYYTIQLISFSTRRQANRFIQQIDNAISNARIQLKDVNGKRYYRVRVGKHPTWKKAKKEARRISKQSRVPNNYWISKVMLQ